MGGFWLALPQITVDAPQDSVEQLYVSSIPEWFRSLENLRHVCANVEVLKHKDL
jgi:hypothetical protein